MRLGWYLSGFGHVVLILGLLFGGLFVGDRIPEPLNVAEVAVVSEQEFAALALPGVAPDAQSDAPDVAAPSEDDAPEPPEADSAPQLAEPDPVEDPPTPETPDITVPEPVVPNAVIVDTEPPVPAPPSEFDGTTLEPDAVAAPAPRVAPVPQVATPEAEIAPEVVPDTAPEPLPEPEPQPEPETPSAPEEASDRIVTEAEEEQTYAPASSRRPRSRPPQPVQVAEPEPEETLEPTTSSTDDAVAAALSDTSEPAEQASAPSGPPLTGGEKDAFRVAVGACWVVDSGGQSAGVKVTVAFSLDRSGKVVGDITQVSATGGDAAAQRTAFEKARRAILRCQRGGYDLPADKYGQWQNIEATFNPEGMQYR